MSLVINHVKCFFAMQISDGAQKLEEIALKKSRLLVPMMPYMPRSMVLMFLSLFLSLLM